MARVLVIDDDPGIRTLVSVLLTGAGYHVLEASDGDEGLRTALKESPDLVLCDIGMPGLDGYALLNELRGHQSTAPLPVIFLTGHASPEARREGMERGADDYITKPFSPHELLRAVSARLARQQPTQQSLRRATRSLEIIRGSSDLLIRAADEGGFVSGVCRLLVEQAGYRFAWIGIAEPAAKGQLRVAAREGADACAEGEAVPSPGSFTRSAKATERAFRSGLPVARRTALGCGTGSAIGVPLLAGSRSFGVLTLQSDDPDAFDEQEANLLTHLAGHLAFGIVTLRARGERARVQSALEDLRHRNDLILNSAAEGICGTDAGGVLTFANPAAEAMLGWPRGTAVGRALHDFFHAGNGATNGHGQAGCPLEARIARGTPQRVVEDEFRRRDGSRLPVEYATAPIREDGTVEGAVVIFRDITERKRAERELFEAHQQVLRAEQDRKRFYQEVVHAVTHGKLHLVDAEEMPELGNRVLEVTLKNMHDYPRFRHTLARAGKRMGMCDRNVMDWVLASAEAAANALKHAGGGSITAYADEGRGILRVTDHGGGIRPEHLTASIFQPGFSTAISLGVGYTLILRLSDEVWLATDPRGTVIQLAKAFEPHPEWHTPLTEALQRL